MSEQPITALSEAVANCRCGAEMKSQHCATHRVHTPRKGFLHPSYAGGTSVCVFSGFFVPDDGVATWNAAMSPNDSAIARAALELAAEWLEQEGNNVLAREIRAVQIPAIMARAKETGNVG